MTVFTDTSLMSLPEVSEPPRFRNFKFHEWWFDGELIDTAQTSLPFLHPDKYDMSKQVYSRTVLGMSTCSLSIFNASTQHVWVETPCVTRLVFIGFHAVENNFGKCRPAAFVQSKRLNHHDMITARATVISAQKYFIFVFMFFRRRFPTLYCRAVDA